MEYIQKYYRVPAEIGRRVECYGESGIIAEDRGNYIGVLLDKDKPNDIKTYHPTSEVKYLGMGKVRKMTRSQKRYMDYLHHGNLYETFAEYLGISQVKEA